MKLAIGDAVVYHSHGPGHVSALEHRPVLGVEQQVVVIQLAGGLSVTLPVSRAAERLRPVIDEDGVRRVQEALGSDVELSADGWLKRSKAGRAKLTGGDSIDLAEIIRDGARRARRLNERGSVLSFSEKEMCGKARLRLANEIALARGLEPGEADAWIGDQLTIAAGHAGPA